MEVVRDKDDNCIIVCSIENVDPMGVHTGDFDHRRAGADADRQGIPDHARRLDRGAARDRGRDRRLERAVRGQSGGRPPGRHRDEPAGVALLGAGLEGDRLPDRQGRGQARGRLHARRDRQRHHRRRDAGLVRADHRLRRHQDPALRLREISRRRADADHLDEVGRRGDGDRPHLPGKPAEGAALAGDRPDRPRRDRDRGRSARATTATRSAPRSARRRPTACCKVAQAMRLGLSDEQIHAACKIDPWFLAADPRHRRDRGARSRRKGLPASAAAFRRLKAMGFSDARLGKLTGRSEARGHASAPRARRAAGVQAHRHLRRRVRLAHRLHVFDLRGAVRRPPRRRGRAVGPEEGGDPRRRAEPHRPGHRVRLLLLPRRLRAAARPATRPS